MAAPPHQNDDMTSNSSLSDEGEEGEWEDAEADEENIQVTSLFDDKVFPSAEEMLDYCKEKYGFDFVSLQRQHSQS